MSAEEPSVLCQMGDSAVSFSRPEAVSAASLSQWLRVQEGVLDVVLSEKRIAIYFDPQRPPPRLAQLPAACAQLKPVATTGQTHRIAVTYDGADLEAVARATGLPVAEVIALHAGCTYQVGMLGFMPGFAYLQGLSSQLVLPRRSEPRARIPVAAVAIGGAYSAIYPCASPGGWNLLGTAVEPALLNADGARFQLGDRVIFEPVA